MENPTTGRHRRPCNSMAGRVWALTAALLATALAALFIPGRTIPGPRALSAAPSSDGDHRRGRRGGDLLADPPEQDIWATGVSIASERWEQAHRDRSTPFEPEDAVNADPDQLAGALVRLYLDRTTVPRPRPAEPNDHPAMPSTVEPEPVEDEFAELADRIRTYLAIRN